MSTWKNRFFLLDISSLFVLWEKKGKRGCRSICMYAIGIQCLKWNNKFEWLYVVYC